MSIGGEEDALAAAGQKQVDKLLSGLREDLRMPPGRLRFFLSCLRQAIEQELVQLRIASPNPKASHTDATCVRHVDLQHEQLDAAIAELLAELPDQGRRQR